MQRVGSSFFLNVVFFIVLWMGVICDFFFFLTKTRKENIWRGWRQRNPIHNSLPHGPELSLSKKRHSFLWGEEEGTQLGCGGSMRVMPQTSLDSHQPPGMGVRGRSLKTGDVGLQLCYVTWRTEKRWIKYSSGNKFIRTQTLFTFAEDQCSFAICQRKAKWKCIIVILLPLNYFKMTKWKSATSSMENISVEMEALVKIAFGQYLYVCRPGAGGWDLLWWCFWGS